MKVVNLEPKDWSRVRRAMQDAISKDEVPPELAAAITTRIRAEATKSPRSTVRWLAAAAAAVVIASVGVAVQLSSSVSGTSTELARAGLDHHVHCAQVRPLPAVPPTAEAMSVALGPELGGLVPLVAAHAGEGYALLDAHTCRSNGREFAHVVCRNGRELVSVIVTSRSGELAEGAGGTAILDGVSVAAMPTREHVAFVVGTADDTRHLAVSVRDYVAVAES